MKTIVILAAIALFACGKKDAAAPSGTAQKPKERESSGVITLDRTQQQKGHIAVVTVAAREIAESLTVPGQLTFSEDRTWRVGAVVGGKVDELTAKVGDFIRAGQIVGRIHSHDVHEARAAYRQASTELDRARAAEVYSRRLRDRAQRLLELKAGSRQELETAESNLLNAQATIAKAESEIVKERAHLTEILHISIDDRPGSTQPPDGVPIFAPASGTVMDRKATAGSVLNAGDEILSLSDTRSLWMIAAANEVDLSKIRTGQTVRIEVRAYPGREFSGRVLRLGEKLDPTTRTLQIRILVPNSQGLLKPEMYATAFLPQTANHAVLMVPDEAIQDINGVPAIFVRKQPTEFEPRSVKTGHRTNGETEIVDGLKPGEEIVVKGSFLLKSQLLRRAIEE